MTKTILLILITFLSSCASDPLLLTKSAEKDYNTAQRLIAKKEYTRALIFLEKYAAKYPYSRYATDAELLRVQAAYKNGEEILSETLALRFMEAHPKHQKRITAEYLLAMSYYKQSSKASLDQQFSHKAIAAFQNLNKHFPKSHYTQEVQKYLKTLSNRVAKHEMLVAKFYYDKHLFVAATNRFIYIKNKYLNTDIAPESLYLLISSYLELKQTSYARETLTFLSKSFPKSVWYRKAQQLI